MSKILRHPLHQLFVIVFYFLKDFLVEVTNLAGVLVVASEDEDITIVSVAF